MHVGVERPDHGPAVFVKRSESPEEAERLRRERRLLRRLRHPGVVELAPDDGDDGCLRLRHVDGVDLTERTFGPEEVAGLGAAGATTLADLHDLGIAHGSCGAAHILVDAEGRPVLCGFGAVRPADAGGREDDVRGLLGALLTSLAGDTDGLRRRLERWHARPPGARSLARQLAEAVPAARLPRGAAATEAGETGELLVARDPAGREGAEAGEATLGESRLARDPVATAGTTRSASDPLARAAHSRRRTTIAAVAPVICGAVASLALVVAHGGATGGSPGGGCPPADRGCGPLPHPGGVLLAAGGRWAVGAAGDVVVLGRWHCGAPLPALLRPATGQVWLFDQWPAAGRPVTGRLVATVPGAGGLRVLPRRTCDSLEAVTGRRSVRLLLGNRP